MRCDDLPLDILRMICSKLTTKDLLTVAVLSKRWRKLAGSIHCDMTLRPAMCDRLDTLISTLPGATRLELIKYSLATSEAADLVLAVSHLTALRSFDFDFKDYRDKPELVVDLFAHVKLASSLSELRLGPKFRFRPEHNSPALGRKVLKHLKRFTSVELLEIRAALLSDVVDVAVALPLLTALRSLNTEGTDSGIFAAAGPSLLRLQKLTIEERSELKLSKRDWSTLCTLPHLRSLILFHASAMIRYRFNANRPCKMALPSELDLMKMTSLRSLSVPFAMLPSQSICLLTGLTKLMLLTCETSQAPEPLCQCEQKIRANLKQLKRFSTGHQ